jgi:hypothetical protein
MTDDAYRGSEVDELRKENSRLRKNLGEWRDAYDELEEKHKTPEFDWVFAVGCLLAGSVVAWHVGDLFDWLMPGKVHKVGLWKTLVCVVWTALLGFGATAGSAAFASWFVGTFRRTK